MLIIPFTFILLLQSLHVSLEDIVKIPELVEHYQEHKAKSGDDFFAFLNKHYGGQKEQHESENHENHDDLPFHHSQHVCIDLKVDVPLLFVAKQPESEIPEHYFYYEEPQTSAAATNLLQPPKNNC